MGNKENYSPMGSKISGGNSDKVATGSAHSKAVEKMRREHDKAPSLAEALRSHQNGYGNGYMDSTPSPKVK